MDSTTTTRTKGLPYMPVYTQLRQGKLLKRHGLKGYIGVAFMVVAAILVAPGVYWLAGITLVIGASLCLRSVYLMRDHGQWLIDRNRDHGYECDCH